MFECGGDRVAAPTGRWTATSTLAPSSKSIEMVRTRARRIKRFHSPLWTAEADREGKTHGFVTALVPSGASTMTSQIRIINKTDHWPVHAALSWNDTQQQCVNDLAAGKEHSFGVGWGWHDLTVVAGGSSNRFNSNDNNKINVGRLLLQGLNCLPPVVGLIDPIVRIAGNPGLYEPPALTTDDVQVVGTEKLVLKPVRVTRLYAPDGYTITLKGLKVNADYAKTNDGKLKLTEKGKPIVIIESITALELHWENSTSHSHGKEVAQ